MTEEAVKEAKALFQRAFQALDTGDYEFAVSLMVERTACIRRFSESADSSPEDIEALLADTLTLQNDIKARIRTTEDLLHSYLTSATATKAYKLSEIASKPK